MGSYRDEPWVPGTALTSSPSPLQERGVYSLGEGRQLRLLWGRFRDPRAPGGDDGAPRRAGLCAAQARSPTSLCRLPNTIEHMFYSVKGVRTGNLRSGNVDFVHAISEVPHIENWSALHGRCRRFHNSGFTDWAAPAGDTSFGSSASKVI
jgi:hypothetical protein